MEVWCQWRPSADGSSDSPQLRTNSPEVRTSPNFPTWSAVIRPKVIKNKNYRLPPQKHSLYELLPACEPAAPELELLAIHGPTKLQSGHFALFRYEKRNILCHGGKKSKSEWSSVTFPGGDRSLQKKSRGRRFWQKKKFLGEKSPAGKNSLWKKSWRKRNIPEEIGRQWECVKGSWWKYSWWKNLWEISWWKYSRRKILLETWGWLVLFSFSPQYPQTWWVQQRHHYHHQHHHQHHRRRYPDWKDMFLALFLKMNYSILLMQKVLSIGFTKI